MNLRAKANHKLFFYEKPLPFLFDILSFMQPKLFDIHSHLNFPEFDKDREKVIEHMKENGIWTICVGTDEKTSKECVELAKKHENIFASVGLHPTEETEFPTGNSVSVLRELAKNQKVVAIGECGIDLYRKKNFDDQKELFIKQIKLSLELNKPLMIHCREAHDDLIEILKAEGYKLKANLRGNIHFFSGTWQQAQKYFDLGFTISFAGPITFTNQYDEIIKNTPIDKIMIETDAPFVAPVPYRGRRCEPSYVIEVAKKIAGIKGISIKQVKESTIQNALKFFINNDKF